MSDPILLALTSLDDAQRTVVPVVAQAGTALAPLIAVGITNTIGLLMKPKELMRVLRAKPWILLILMIVGIAGWAAWSWLMAPPAAAVSARGATGSSTAGVGVTDWSKVALEIIRQRQAGPAPAPAPAAPEAAGQPVSGTAPGIATPFYFRGGSGRSGHLGGTAPSSLKQTWVYYPEDDRLAMMLSSPAVHGGRVFGASCLLDPPGSYGTVFCLDAATGTELWLSTRLDQTKKTDFVGFFSSPALTADGKNLIIGQGLHLDYDAHLVCLDATNGAVRWTIPTPMHLESSPAIEGDVVVIGVGAVEQGDDHKPVGDPAGKGNPGFVLGVRISTGEVLFREPVIDPESSPVLKDGICYIGSGMNGSRIVALRANLSDAELANQKLNRKLWDVSTPYPATGAVTLSGDHVLIGCGKGDFVFAAPDPEGRVIALDAKTGANRWSAVLPDAILGAIATDGNFAAVPCRNGEIIAIDLAAQGKELWRARVNKQAPILAAPAIAGDLVYAVSNDGWLAVLKRSDGSQVERLYINAPERPGELNLSTSSPLIINGKLYVGSETGGLRCYTGSAR